MKQETKEYIDTQLAELAKQLRTEIGDTAQRIHERIGAVHQELDEVRRHTDEHCRLGGHNANITNALCDDFARRLDVLDKLAGVSSVSPQLDSKLEALNRQYDEAERQATNPFASLFEGIFGGGSPFPFSPR